MKTDITTILNLTKYFRPVKSLENNIQFRLETPSHILRNNIHMRWLRSVLAKSKAFPVYVCEDLAKKSSQNKLPFGYLSQRVKNIDENTVMEYDLVDGKTLEASELKLNLIVPKHDVMQYFIQWQRYRKYWWSSITTTPSLFSVDDIKYGDHTADVHIVAKFSCGPQIVETVAINTSQKNPKNTSNLSCEFSLENALFVLLLDALTNSTKEKYLRLHRTMAPFKMSYALEEAANKTTLKELATLLHHRLASRNISSILPELSLHIDNQITENLQLGVPYTAILSERTLQDGIFHLKNSSTMLNEMVHVADFENYAALICNK